jgi:hypothetical protein
LTQTAAVAAREWAGNDEETVGTTDAGGEGKAKVQYPVLQGDLATRKGDLATRKGDLARFARRERETWATRKRDLRVF